MKTVSESVSSSVNKMSRTKKIILILGSLVASVLVGAFLFVYFSFTGSLPQTEGELALVGLESPVEITYDSMGVPQIWAVSAHDGYFALGYQHAADRLFQMELVRRVSQGTLSELFGALALEVDIKARIAGHMKSAQSAVARFEEADRARLSSYVAGINSYLGAGNSLPFEFLMLRINPEHWTIEDCLAVLSFQTWFSDALQNRDEFFIKVAEKLGEEKARTLLLPYPDWAPYTVPEKAALGSVSPIESGRDYQLQSMKNKNLSSVFDDAREYIKEFEYLERDGESASFKSLLAREVLANDAGALSMSLGSNGWVVAGENTESGKPILAGDPHLDVTRLPQFWYLVGLHIEEEQSHEIGITSAGLPFTVMGSNGRAAWTMTAAGIDQTDYFAEVINPADSMQYQGPDGWREFAIVAETIQIADTSEPYILNVRKTDNGPIVLEDDSLQFAYSLHWSGFDMDLAVAAHSALTMSQVRDFGEFRVAVTNLAALNSNWLYADSAGTIGYQLGAPVPMRLRGSENLAHGAESDAIRWSGFYPLNETPWSQNPEQGWLANCNNKQDQANLDYDLQGNFFADRILRITERLSSGKKAGSKETVASTKALQTEWIDRYFLRWAPEIADLLDSLGETERASALRNWDGSASRDSKETALVAEFILQLKNLTFNDEIGDLSLQMKRLWVDQIYHSEHEFWFDDVTTVDITETRSEIARKALENALSAVGDSSWGSIHSLTVAHPFAFLPVVGSALGLQRGPFSRGGTGGTVNASYYREAESGVYKTLAAPSWRFVIDLSDPQKAHMCMPAGNSGNPLSEHFFDFYDLWEQGKYWTVTLDKTETYSSAKSVLTLQPAE